MEQIKYLKQGAVVVSDDQKIFTILGSCVAVTLWDPVTKIGGANHFLLPTWPKKGVPDVRYGDIAITELHDKVILAGALKRRLVAKIFGGASLLKLQFDGFQVGRRNIEIAKQKLRELNVPVVEEITGGGVGSKIWFDPRTGEVKHALIQNVNF